MNKKTGHVSLAFEQKGDNVKSLGFTHDDKEKHGKVSKLDYNIDPKDSSPCYVKHKIEKYKSNDYRAKEKYKNHRIHDFDKPKINALIEKSKKERV